MRLIALFILGALGNSISSNRTDENNFLQVNVDIKAAMQEKATLMQKLHVKNRVFGESEWNNMVDYWFELMDQARPSKTDANAIKSVREKVTAGHNNQQISDERVALLLRNLSLQEGLDKNSVEAVYHKFFLTVSNVRDLFRLDEKQGMSDWRSTIAEQRTRYATTH